MNLVSFGMPDALITPGRVVADLKSPWRRGNHLVWHFIQRPLTLNDGHEKKKQPIQVMFGNG
jgi:hypothetical protein